jgi:flagellar basal body-associated protein FliL
VKILRIILIASGVLLLLLLMFPPIVESRSLARAIVAYHDKASQQNKSELERQQEIVRQKRFAESIVIVALLTANTAGLVYVSPRIHLRQRVVAQQSAFT